MAGRGEGGGGEQGKARGAMGSWSSTSSSAGVLQAHLARSLPRLSQGRRKLWWKGSEGGARWPSRGRAAASRCTTCPMPARTPPTRTAASFCTSWAALPTSGVGSL